MKKVILLICLLLVSGCSANNEPTPSPTTDINACQFGEECETNEKVASEMMDWEKISFKDSVNYTEGTNILFFSFDDCPYCVEAIPVLDELVKETDLKIYYVHTTREEREKGNSDYDKVYEHFKDTIEGNGYDKIFMPSIFFIKDGEVVAYHVGTVDGHNPKEAKMNDEQVKELQEIFKLAIDELK